LASTPYQPYKGQLTANMSGNQTAAYNAADATKGAWSPYVSQAGGLYGALAGSTQHQTGLADSAAGLGLGAAFDPSQQWGAQASNWMNPYTSNVVDQIAAAGDQNFNTKLMPSINSQFLSSGDFNSLSNMGGLSQGAAEAQQGITSAQAAALQSGYGTSQTNFLTNKGIDTGTATNAANAATAAGNMATSGYGGAASGTAGLGTTTSALNTQDINNLASTGQTAQTTGQAGLTAALNQYNTGQNWLPSQLSNSSSAMSGLPWAGTVSGTSSAPLSGAGYNPSPLAQAGTTVGGLGTLASNLGSAASSISGLGSQISNWLQ
jgi:hypothetical protein